MSDRINQPRISSTVIASHFPTVFMLREFEGGEALDRKLADLMLRLEKETVNIAFRTTNIGGYHSEPNLFTRKEPELGSLRELIQQALDDYLPNFLAANCHVPPANLKMRPWGWGQYVRFISPQSHSPPIGPRRSSHRQMDAAASTDHNSSDACCPCDHRRRFRGLYWGPLIENQLARLKIAGAVLVVVENGRSLPAATAMPTLGDRGPQSLLLILNQRKRQPQKPAGKECT